jgi:hypothetical protein
MRKRLRGAAESIRGEVVSRGWHERPAWRSVAAAPWLVVDNEGRQRVEPGTVVIVTKGSHPVAYLHVAEVAST